MSDHCDAEEDLITLKQQSKDVIKFLREFHYRDYVYVMKKLGDCSRVSVVKDNRIDQNKLSCDSIFCPICAATHKINREMAIAYPVVDEIIASSILDNGRKSVPIMQSLTLTIPNAAPYEFEDTFKQLKLNYKLLLDTEMKKASGKFVSFRQSLRGHSVYYHLSFKDNYEDCAVVGVHLHAILLLNPSFKGKKLVTGKMLAKCWQELNGERYLLETNMDPLAITYDDYKQATKSGLLKFNFDDIIANPRKFLAVLPYIQGQHFVSHYGDLRTFRAEAQREYKKRRNDELIANLDQLDAEEAAAIANLL